MNIFGRFRWKIIVDNMLHIFDVQTYKTGKFLLIFLCSVVFFVFSKKSISQNQNIVIIITLILKAIINFYCNPLSRYRIFIVDSPLTSDFLCSLSVIFRGSTVRHLVITKSRPMREFGRVTVTTKLGQLS